MSKCSKCGIGDRAYQQCQVECPVESVTLLSREGDAPILDADLCKRCSSRVLSYIARAVSVFWNDEMFTTELSEQYVRTIAGDMIQQDRAYHEATEKA